MLSDHLQRVLYTPYWCRGNPLMFKDGGVGPGWFAADGHVGLFNLTWWGLGCPNQPLTVAEYRAAAPFIRWVQGPANEANFYGRTVVYRAAMWKLPEFNNFMDEALEYAEPFKLMGLLATGPGIAQLKHLVNNCKHIHS